MTANKNAVLMNPRVGRHFAAAQSCTLLCRRIAFGVMAGAVLILSSCSKAPEGAAGSESGAEMASRVKRGQNGETIVALDEAMQRQIGLKTKTLTALDSRPEEKGYGQVVNPAPLAALVADYAAAKAANVTSEAELKRLRILATQNNASERAVQAAESVAIRDAAQFESARLKLLVSWGSAIAGREDLPAFVESLGKLEAALVRVDLPAGELLKDPHGGARLVLVASDEKPFAAEWLEQLPTVDPQTQGHGYLFLVHTNSAGLAPGAALTAYLQVGGEPEKGVLIPRAAVIRHQGEAWVFLQTDGTNFVRRAIKLERPLDDGWFIRNGVAPGDEIVVTGAQTVFSEELNASGFMSGERD